MTDGQNSENMSVDYTNTVDIEFSVDPKDLLYGWWFCMQNNAITWKILKREIFTSKFATRVTYSLPNGL